MGFDSEWVRQDRQNSHVLSYQYAVKVGSEMLCVTVYTVEPKRENRWTLANLMGHAIEDARSVGV